MLRGNNSQYVYKGCYDMKEIIYPTRLQEPVRNHRVYTRGNTLIVTPPPPPDIDVPDDWFVSYIHIPPRDDSDIGFTDVDYVVIDYIWDDNGGRDLDTRSQL